jgi:flagellar motor switch protein FliN
MADLTPAIVGEVIETCRESAAEIAEAFTRALDSKFVGVTIEEGTTYNAGAAPAGFDGPGLAIVFKFGEAGAVAVLPEASGLLPDWYGNPDATGKSKLSTLAQELSMLLVPASLAAEEFHAVRVEKLSGALQQSEPAADAALLPLVLKCDEKQGQLSFLWPLAKPGEIVAKPAAAEAPATEDAAEEKSEPAPAAKPANDEAADDASNLPRLPEYTRSLFKVRVPVSVNLATQKQTVKEILELVPGSIIKFEKSCDELLEVMVGDQPVAAGEVVKVGDKFGLRIRNMTLPAEQFVAIKATMSQ